MNLTGADRVKLAQILAKALQGPVRLQMAVDAAFNTPLVNIAAPNLTLDEATFHVVTWADARAPDDVLKFVEAARDFNPDNPELAAIAKYITEKKRQIQAHQAPDLLPDAAHPAGAPERMLHRIAGFVNVLQFRQRQTQREAAVCRMELQAGVGEGTGFLVGPNLVLTNYHVFDAIWDGKNSPKDVVARFDYKVGLDGVTVPAGRTCQLAQDWKVALSVKGEGAEELDFLLLRLSEAPGHDSVAELAGAKRGWLKLIARDIEPGEPLVILQHPLTRPMQLALGSVMEIHAPQKRVIHDVNTEPGSSGSPCFDAQWNPIALHYFGAKAGNRAVMFGPILEQIQSLLTASEQPAPAPASD